VKLPLPVSLREQENGYVRWIVSKITGHIQTVGECGIEKSGKIEAGVNVNMVINHKQRGAAGWM